MKYSILTLSCLIFFSCKTNKSIGDGEPMYEMVIEELILDTLTVSAPRNTSHVRQSIPTYRASTKRTHDLLHTKLELTFNWVEQSVIGVATLQLTPIRDTDRIELDAKNFSINEVKVNGRSTDKFTNTGKNLIVEFDDIHNRGEKYTIQIDYVARPNEGEESGSAAITSDQGLFFINPDGSILDKPQQIWTQGETEHNSRWFPTIDKPNERCSQEMYLTVEKRFKTLSNGKLVSSTINSDGTRTDYWKQDLPHAPYLFMIVVGEFHIDEDEWNQKPLMYYVEPEFANFATDIFNHTPEMLTFFSEILNYDYPWDKYAQVVVRDYVSGAMENTSAVIFGEFVQKNDRELIDNHNDLIVAHELFHHWFGDLVTCESWSNLTLNEGFANYAEYLWLEHKYGKEYAEAHRINELTGYLQSTIQQGIHPLIHYRYDDKEEMFDAHSYNKGGLVLHMLRDYLGDEIFFLGLNRYLTLHAYSEVEAAELRLAMEDVSGEDLNWFFNQWYHSSGHPELKIAYDYNIENKSASISILQIQDHQLSRAIFQIPFVAKMYMTDGSIRTEKVELNKREQVFIIENIEEKPAAIVLDGQHIFLGTKEEIRSDEEWVFLFNNSDAYQDKYEAIRNLRGSEMLHEIIQVALSEAHYFFRSIAADRISDKHQLESLIMLDPHSIVRERALRNLHTLDIQSSLSISKKMLNSEKAYPVISLALEIIAEHDLDLAAKKVLELSRAYPKPFHGSMFNILSKTENPSYLKHFDAQINKVDIYHILNFYEQYQNLAFKASPGRIIESTKVLRKQAENDSMPEFRRYLSLFSINELKRNLESRQSEENITKKEDLTYAIESLNKTIDEIIESEQDSNLRARYNSLITK